MFESCGITAFKYVSRRGRKKRYLLKVSLCGQMSFFKIAFDLQSWHASFLIDLWDKGHSLLAMRHTFVRIIRKRSPDTDFIRKLLHLCVSWKKNFKRPLFVGVEEHSLCQGARLGQRERQLDSSLHSAALLCALSGKLVQKRVLWFLCVCLCRCVFTHTESLF